MSLTPNLSFELYNRAAQNAVLPFERIYFDTEPLRAGGWPRSSKQLHAVLQLAFVMEMDLYLPEPVALEREEQWLREARSKIASILSKTDAFNADAANITDFATVTLPNEERLHTDYRVACANAQIALPLTVVAFTNRSAREIFELATRRDFTFEEKGGGAVVGFQDAVILLSVIDHLLVNNVSAAFVSKDPVFQRIPQINRRFGTGLIGIAGLDDLERILGSALSSAFGAVIREWLNHEERRIKEALEAVRQDLIMFVKGTLPLTEIEIRLGGSIISDFTMEIKEINHIRPAFPHERAGDRVEFWFDLSVQLSALVEVRPYSFLLVGLGPSNEVPVPVRMNRASTVSVHVDANSLPDYSGLHFESAHLTP